MRTMEDYTAKYIGEHVELWLYGGEPAQDGTLTAFCIVGDVQHVELNSHILVPLVNVAGIHCLSRCDSPGEDHWPPTLGDDLDELDK